MRKVFIKTDKIPMEILLPENRFALTSDKAGQYVQLKGEFNMGKCRLFLCQENPIIPFVHDFCRCRESS